MWKEALIACLKYYPKHLLGEAEENDEKCLLSG
jgi:hypothetical protein